jgi:membrane protease YdiL (CAAX protease family)
MREQGDCGFLDRSLFCITGVVLVGALPIVLSGPLLHLRAIAQIGIALYFFFRRSPLFGPSLFMLVLSLTFFVRFPVSLWLFNLFLATAAYLAALLLYPSIKKHTGWLTPGRVSPADVLAGAAVVLLSAGALFLWARGGLGAKVGSLTDGSLRASAGAVAPGGGSPPRPVSPVGALPPFSNPLLLAAGISGFALFNGAGEEVMFRGIYWDGLASLFRSPCAVVLTQALFFGLCHFRGFPSGLVGMGLSFLYGVVTGSIRHRTGGILTPVIAHVLTDAVIAIIVLKAQN